MGPKAELDVLQKGGKKHLPLLRIELRFVGRPEHLLPNLVTYSLKLSAYCVFRKPR
jgi:hypothetical protein